MESTLSEDQISEEALSSLHIFLQAIGLNESQNKEKKVTLKDGSQITIRVEKKTQQKLDVSQMSREELLAEIKKTKGKLKGSVIQNDDAIEEETIPAEDWEFNQ